MRTDAAEGADVTIVRPDLNLVYVINTKRRVYSESPLAVYQQAGRLTMTMLATDPAFQWTGRKKKIAAWSCREVVMAEETGANGDRIKTIWWVTKDPVLTVRLLRHLMTISFGDAIDELATRFYDKLDNVGGFPVQTETEATHGDKSLRRVQTLRKLERREIPDSTFELPPNLTKITVPLPPGFGG